MKLLKLILVPLFLLVSNVNADEFTILCESCSDTQAASLAEQFATHTGNAFTTVNVVDTDTGGIKRYEVHRFSTEELGGFGTIERFSSNIPQTFETIVYNLTPTAEMIEDAKEFKGLMERLAVKESDKSIVENVGNVLLRKYGDSIGRSNFSVVHLPTTGYPNSAVEISIENDLAIIKFIHGKIGIKFSNKLFAMLANNAIGAAIVVFPDGSIRIWKRTALSSIPFQMTDIVFDPTGELMEEALNENNSGTSGGAGGVGVDNESGSSGADGGWFGGSGGGSTRVCTAIHGETEYCYTIFY